MGGRPQLLKNPLTADIFYGQLVTIKFLDNHDGILKWQLISPNVGE